MKINRMWCVGAAIVAVALVGGCGSADKVDTPNSGDAGVLANLGATDPAKAKENLQAALQKMDNLSTYKAEMSISGEFSSNSHVEISNDDDTIYQVIEFSGRPSVGSSKSETLTRPGEYLERSSLYADLMKETDPSVTDQTWFRVPVELGGGQRTVVVSMYFAPASQSITSVTNKGTETVDGRELTLYSAELDREKFKAEFAKAFSAATAEMLNLVVPASLEYGVGSDGYVYRLKAALTGPQFSADTVITFNEFDKPLNLPKPEHIVDFHV